MAGAAAGTELPSWPAAVATDDPTAPTVVPRGAVTGATGLVVPEGSGEPEPVTPLPTPGEVPDAVGEAAGEVGVPVKGEGPTRETCPPGALPARSPASVALPDDSPPDPAAVASDPLGAVEPVDAAPGPPSPLCGRAV